MYISVVSLLVDDVDRAVEFYTKRLGWEKRMDEPMGDGTRWVTIAPPGSQAMFTLSTPERTDSRRSADGMSGVILEVDDVSASYNELTKQGVEFTAPPEAMPWGGWAMFKDSEGNVHGLHSPVRESVTS